MPTTTTTDAASTEDFKWTPGHDRWLAEVKAVRASLEDVIEAGAPLATDTEYAARLEELSVLMTVGDALESGLTGLRDEYADVV